MPADFISVNTSTTTATRAQALKNAVAQFRAAQQALQAELAIMNHAFDGSGQSPVFTVLETLYGLQAGQGQIVFNLVNGSIGAMAGTFQNNQCEVLIAQVG